MVSPEETRSKIRSILRKEAARWFHASGLKIKDVVEKFSVSETRYLKMEKERMTLKISGRLSKLP
jgi:hypothetical protein